MKTKRKTRRIAALWALCLAGIFSLALAGCPNPVEEVKPEKSAAPAAGNTNIAIGDGQLSVEIPLTSAHTGEWKVYAAEDAAAPAGLLSVFFAPSTKTLTLTSSASLDAGDYWITVTESGKTESARLKITLAGPSAAPGAASSSAVDLTDGQTSAAFTLAAAIEGEWKVYAEERGGVPLTTVSVTVSETTLTLAGVPADTPLPAGVYYVAVTQSGKAESARLKLTLNAYNADRTAIPVVSETAVVKITKPTAQAAFTLTNSYGGEPTWALYAGETGAETPAGVELTVNGTSLTLKHETDIPLGAYYVTAKEGEKAESSRLALEVTLPDSITFTVDTNSVSGTASGGGESVGATVTGSPSYSTVDSLNVLTFNTAVDGNFENGDFVSLNPIAGAYMPEDNWTMELIVKSPTNGQLLSFWGPNGRNNAGSFWIEHSTGGGYWLFRVYDQSANKGVGISRPSTGTWHHVAYVRTGGTVTCYVDGEQAAASANAGNPNATFNDAANTYFENPAMAQITNCLIGMRQNNQFHRFKISKSAITPSSNASYYSDAAIVVNTLNGVKTDTPVVSSAAYTKTQTQEATATFALTNSAAYAGSVTWKVYAAATGDTLATGVTASLSESTLTLTHASDIPAGDYYVSAAEAGKGESGRLPLTVVNQGATPTATPAVSSATGGKTSKPTAQVNFTLTNLTSGEITWKLYTADTGGAMWDGVSASSSGNTLTLQGADVPAGTYYVTATESGKTESERLALTVSLPDSITFTVGSNAVTGTASGGSGSVSATVNGSPSYLTVNGLNVLTFNTAVDGNFENGDFVSLNPIAGAYMPEDNWTMELIVKSPTNGQLLSFWGPNGRNNAGCFWIEHSTGGGYWLFRVYNGSGSDNKGVGISRPSTNAWHHVAYVRTGGTVTCYVDGVQAASANAGNPNATFNDTPATYFENPAFAQISNCLIGMRQNNQFHRFKISKSAITPSGDSGYYTDAATVVNALNGVKTDTPQVSSSTYTKTQATEATATFTLTNTYAGSVTWKVYAAATGDALATGVTASLSGSTLTLTHASDIPAGDYYVSAAEAGKGESGRLILIVVNQGATPTAVPTVSSASGGKTSKPTAQVNFTLTNLTSGAITWKLYTADTGGTMWEGVNASSSGSTLTLSGADVPAGTYYVTATEAGKTESPRTVLTVSLPDSIAFTVGENSVTGTASPGGSVGATVNGNGPDYSAVGGLNVLTFNTNVSFDSSIPNAPTGGDYVRLDPIAGDYIPEDNWTLELIVKPASENGAILNFWGPNGRNNTGSFWVEKNNNYWMFRVYNGSGSANKSIKIVNPSVGAWHHVTFVRTGGTVTCYVDGVQAETFSGETTSTNPNTTFNDAANTYFENPAMAQLAYCLFGMRRGHLFHQVKISKSAITPDSNSSYYTDAAGIVATLNGT